MITCTFCKGTGEWDDKSNDDSRCDVCNGRGWFVDPPFSVKSSDEFYYHCNEPYDKDLSAWVNTWITMEEYVKRIGQCYSVEFTEDEIMQWCSYWNSDLRGATLGEFSKMVEIYARNKGIL